MMSCNNATRVYTLRHKLGEMDVLVWWDNNVISGWDVCVRVGGDDVTIKTTTL